MTLATRVRTVCPVVPAHGRVVAASGVRGAWYCPVADHDGRPKTHPSGRLEPTRAFFTTKEVEQGYLDPAQAPTGALDTTVDGSGTVEPAGTVQGDRGGPTGTAGTAGGGKDPAELVIPPAGSAGARRRGGGSPVAVVTPIRSARNGSTEVDSATFAQLAAAVGQVVQIPIDLVDVGRNVRVNVEAIDELAASIAEHGVLQPIKVRPSGDRWTVVWGQRRLLAARQAGLERIPAIVAIVAGDEAPEKRSIEQLVENLHRADLNPIDRARAMREVVNAGLSQADLARKLGIAPSTVANDLGLLEAPTTIQTAILEGELSPAHAKALKGLAPSTQRELAGQAMKLGLSAHATETLVQDHKRSEVWRKEHEAASAKQAEEKRARLADGLERVAKRIPKDAAIHLQGYNDTGHLEAELKKLLEAAGYTKVVSRGGPWFGNRKDSIDCNCTAWSLELGYAGTVILHQACTVRKHNEAKSTASWKAQQSGYELQGLVRAKLAEVFVDQLATIGPLAARVALWTTLGWQRGEWAKARDVETATKRKRRDPWASITEAPDDVVRAALTKRLASDFRDGDFKVDWATLATELGIEAAS